MTSSLVQPLFHTPLDIVGDVHGELDALRSLLGHLGYDGTGAHPQGRRLVFVGDLTDRGPDSPGVVDLVRRLVAAERAQCVLGNHDLNILLRDKKHDNGWFFGEEHHEDGALVPQVLADAAIKRRVRELFGALPLALERDDLRVVHACWRDEEIEIIRKSTNAAALYTEHRDRIESSLAGRALDETDEGLAHQNENPVKLLTSGPEERVATPFQASGKKRYEERVEWWRDYDGAFCVFGHYAIPADKPHGGSAAFCVDHGVGARWKERRAGKNSGFESKLAALRWPERVVCYDEGERRSAVGLS